MAPLAIDLFCGLGGWTEGLLAEGYRVVGFDIERHVYGEARYPAQLVLQDVLTIHGAQFKDADLIVASPPCQAYSYRAMPWKRAKALPPPDNSLFWACFRIQREACEAAGRHIPLVVENVRGAQTYVGRARWHFGSFYLWGDVPALMPIARGRKNNGGSWFAVAHNTTSGKGQNPDGRKTRAFEPYSSSGVTDSRGRYIDPASPVALLTEDDVLNATGRKNGGDWFNVAHNTTSGKGQNPDGRKVGKDWFGGYGGGFGWDSSPMRRNSSKSKARKAASAHIAKIPLALSRHIARAWYPLEADCYATRAL